MNGSEFDDAVKDIDSYWQYRRFTQKLFHDFIMDASNEYREEWWCTSRELKSEIAMEFIEFLDYNYEEICQKPCDETSLQNESSPGQEEVQS